MHVIVSLYGVCPENTREHDAHSETSKNPAEARKTRTATPQNGLNEPDYDLKEARATCT